MADSEPKQQSPETVQVQDSNINSNGNNEKKLKYLEFVQVAAIYSVVCFSTVYEYAKENSGPLKPGVQTVEATVKTVVGPVYEKFHDVPFQLLRFVDRKVDATLGDLEGHVPGAVKAAAEEVRRAGAAEAAKTLWKKYEPAAEARAVAAWRWLNRLPLFPEAAQMVVPTAAYWSEKYNRAVVYAAERGVPAAAYLPLVPLERIAKVFEEPRSGPAEEFEEPQSGPTVVANGDASSDSAVAAQ